MDQFNGGVLLDLVLLLFDQMADSGVEEDREDGIEDLRGVEELGCFLFTVAEVATDVVAESQLLKFVFKRSIHVHLSTFGGVLEADHGHCLIEIDFRINHLLEQLV